jgi:hypothetical protein
MEGIVCRRDIIPPLFHIENPQKKINFFIAFEKRHSKINLHVLEKKLDRLSIIIFNLSIDNISTSVYAHRHN